MGDRGNVIIFQRENQPEPLVFYSHWGGSDLQRAVVEAIASAPGRWTDESYLARIVFEKITEGFSDQFLGFAIATEIGDNEHPLVIIDVPAQRVVITDAAFNAPVYSQLPGIELAGLRFADCAALAGTPDWDGEIRSV